MFCVLIFCCFVAAMLKYTVKLFSEKMERNKSKMLVLFWKSTVIKVTRTRWQLDHKRNPLYKWPALLLLFYFFGLLLCILRSVCPSTRPYKLFLN